MTTSPIDQLIEDTTSLEPGDMNPGDYIRKPQAETGDKPEMPGMVVSDINSAGYTVVWDTITREPSSINNNMMATQMKQTRPDGSLVFTRLRPLEGPWRGAIKCFLHEDQPDRQRYAEMGFPTCQKATLPSLFQAENHARNRHRDEWAAVEAEREARERREDRAAQLAVLKLVAPVEAPVAPPVPQEGPMLLVPDEVILQDLFPPAEDIPVDRSGMCAVEGCDWQSHAKKRSTRKTSVSQHVAKAHGA